MSSGDIDDRLADPEELFKLRQDFPEFNEYLTWAWNLEATRTFFIPFAAGISRDGKRPYISYDIRVNILDIECDNALVRHETTEWGAREFCNIGVDYESDPRGHRLGNRVEHDRVCRLLDRDDAWDLYSEIVDPQVILSERAKLEGKPVPLDLALYPYDESIVRKIKEAWHNPRSIEEWKKLT